MFNSMNNRKNISKNRKSTKILRSIFYFYFIFDFLLPYNRAHIENKLVLLIHQKNR